MNTKEQETTKPKHTQFMNYIALYYHT